MFDEDNDIPRGRSSRKKGRAHIRIVLKYLPQKMDEIGLGTIGTGGDHDRQSLHQRMGTNVERFAGMSRLDHPQNRFFADRRRI